MKGQTQGVFLRHLCLPDPDFFNWHACIEPSNDLFLNFANKINFTEKRRLI